MGQSQSASAYSPAQPTTRPKASSGSGPQTATIVCGIMLACYAGLQLALGLFGLVNWLFFAANIGEVPAEDGARGIATFIISSLGVLYALTMIVYVTMLAGGVQMARRKMLWLGFVACVLTMVPCNCYFFLGMPVGIWGFVMLCLPQVREAFD